MFSCEFYEISQNSVIIVLLSLLRFFYTDSFKRSPKNNNQSTLVRLGKRNPHS